MYIDDKSYAEYMEFKNFKETYDASEKEKMEKDAIFNDEISEDDLKFVHNEYLIWLYESGCLYSEVDESIKYKTRFNY